MKISKTGPLVIIVLMLLGVTIMQSIAVFAQQSDDLELANIVQKVSGKSVESGKPITKKTNFKYENEQLVVQSPSTKSKVMVTPSPTTKPTPMVMATQSPTTKPTVKPTTAPKTLKTKKLSAKTGVTVSKLSGVKQDMFQSVKKLSLKSNRGETIEIPVKAVWKDTKLTAYSAEEMSVAYDKKGNKIYRTPKTAMGTTATVGLTVAVDRKLVPLGWWVYIEGIGLRQAQDTGSAIRGRKIDVYFQTNKQARHFGVKKNQTVYVIGPNRPNL